LEDTYFYNPKTNTVKLETLYKRAKTGKIQYWQVEVIEASPANYGWGIVKTSGQLGTSNPLIHRETITQGKNIGKSNETTPMEQAISQAQSDWNSKRDEGYKSQTDLGIGHQKEGVHHGLFTIHGAVQVPAKSLEEVLEACLPQFNTDASGNPKPMLATDWKKIKKINYPVLLQPKLDGVRCLMVVRFNVGAEKPIVFLSRSGKEYTTLDHIAKVVGNYCFVKGEKATEFILDGEIYSEHLTFQEIVAAVKKQRPESLKLKFRAYDIVSSSTQQDRWNETVALVDKIASSEVQLVTTVMCTEEDVKFQHDKWVQEGYEGAMIRLLHGTYAQGQRSRELLKVKEFDETEYYFQNWEKGLRDEDLIAVCSTSIMADGKLFKAKMVGSVQEKQELFASEIKSDSLMTIKHFGLTEDGLPRFPIGKAFRDVGM
jgi:DNA ligase-1